MYVRSSCVVGFMCDRKPLASLQDASNQLKATGGLRCATTPGYFLSTLRVENGLVSVPISVY